MFTANTTHMKITVKEDFRKFKKGDEFELDLKPGEITFLVGHNGCGKSTLMFALRNKMDSFSQIDYKNSDGMKDTDLQKQYRDIVKNVNVEGFDFNKAFFRDTIIDNPISITNAATAWGLISGGGFQDIKKSAGQKSISIQVRMVANMMKILGEHSDERILIGIDELDDSMDVAAQMRMAHIWNDWIFSRYPNASILFITHSLFTVLGATHAGNCINTRCYDVSRKCYCTPEEYFASETGYSIELREIK